MDLVCTSGMFNQALIFIEDKVPEVGGKDSKDLGLPIPRRHLNDSLSREILRETSYDVNELDKYVSTNELLSTRNQRSAYNAILDLVRKKTGGIFFLDTPRGTRKTFVINLLPGKIRQKKKIALAMVSFRIAAILLQGSRTAHSILNLPLNLKYSENHLCIIGKGVGQVKILQECELIVWNECTMVHKNALEALDRTLQDLRGNQTFMGRVVVLLASDYRQTLLVIPKETVADDLTSHLKP